MEEPLDRDSLLFHALQRFCDGLNSIASEIGMEAGQVRGGYVNAALVFYWMSERTHRDATQFFQAWQDFSPPQTWVDGVSQIAEHVRSILLSLEVGIVFPLKQARDLPFGPEGETRAAAEIQKCLPRAKKILEEMQAVMARTEFQAAAPPIRTVQLPDERVKSESKQVAIVELDIQDYSMMAELLRHRITRELDEVLAIFWLNARIRSFIRQALAAVQAEEDCFLESKGDGAYLVFPSVDLAHRFADHIHEQTRKYNSHRPDPVQFHFRIGIAYGRVIIRPFMTADNVFLGFGMGGYPLIHAVRLEQGCPVDGVVVMARAHEELSDECKVCYTGPRQLLGKRTEQYEAYIWDRKQSHQPPPP